MEKLHTIGPVLVLVVQGLVGSNPRDVVAREARLGVAGTDHDASVGQDHALVAVPRKSRRRLLRLRPGLSLVATEHDLRASRAVLANETAELVAIGRAEDPRFTQIESRHVRDDARRLPGEAAVARHGRADLERTLVDAALALNRAVIGSEIGAVLQPHDAVEREHAAKLGTFRRHCLPGLAAIFAHHRRHRIADFRSRKTLRMAHPRRGGVFPLLDPEARPAPQAALAGGILQIVDDGTLDVVRRAGRQQFIAARPAFAAVRRPREIAPVAAVMIRPHAEQRLSVVAEDRVRMPLHDLLRTRRDNRMPPRLARDVHIRLRHRHGHPYQRHDGRHQHLTFHRQTPSLVPEMTFLETVVRT